MEFLGLATLIAGGVHCLTSTPKARSDDNMDLTWIQPYKYVAKRPMLLQQLMHYMHLIHPFVTAPQRANISQQLGTSYNTIVKLEHFSEQFSNTDNHHLLWGFNYKAQQSLHVLHTTFSNTYQVNTELKETVRNLTKVAEDMVHNISQNVYYV